MKESDIALAPLPQADGRTKNRPVLLLRKMPPYEDYLVCGISTQLRQEVVGFDEIVSTADADFSASGLKAPLTYQARFSGSFTSNEYPWSYRFGCARAS